MKKPGLIPASLKMMKKLKPGKPEKCPDYFSLVPCKLVNSP
jgi:hypothetical protein